MKKELGLWSAALLGIAGNAPAYSIAITGGILVGAVGHGATTALMIGAVLMIGIISAYAKLNSLHPNPGAAFEWASNELGRLPGFFTGWALLMAACLFLVSAVLPAGEATVLLFSAELAKNKLLTGCAGLAWLFIIYLIVNRGIEAVGRVQMIISTLEIFLLLLIAVVAFRANNNVNFKALFEFDWKALPRGITLSVFMYWGWDVIFNAAEKTKNTEVVSAQAGRLAITTLAVLFSLFAFLASQTVTAEELAASSGNLLFALADKTIPKPWSTFAALTFLLSAIGAIEASMVQFSQTLLAKSRKKVLPSQLSVLSKKHGSPSSAIFINFAAGFLLVGLSLALPTAQSAITAAINASSIWVAFYYGMAAISCAKYFLRAPALSRFQFVAWVVLPLVSATVLLAALFLSLESLPIESLVAIGVTFVLGGVFYYAGLNSRSGFSKAVDI
jgi:amino acid transporter